MQTSNTFLEERRNLQAMYSRKTIDTQWTQQLIQPLQTAYGPGQEIRLVLQRSKHMVDLGKGIQLAFRPVIQFNADQMPDIARKSFMCCTPVLASDFFNLAQVTMNGNAICAQSNISLSKPRNLFQNYYNSLISKKKYRIDGEDAVYSGTVFPSQYGSSNVGFSENSITHPNGQVNEIIANSQPIINLQMSKYEADPYPRAIISKMWTYNQEFNLAPSNNAIGNSNPYYSGYMTGNGHMPPTANFGGVPQNGALNGGEVAGTTYQSNFPLIGLMQTASTCQYQMVNERFQKMRMRFITATTTCYAYANGPSGTDPADTPIQVSTTVPTGQLQTSYAEALVLQCTGVESTFAETAFDPQNMPEDNLTQLSQTSLVGPQFQTYGTSVQGPLGTGSCVPSQSNINRNRLGTPWTQASSTFFPQENYTNLMVPLSDISIELDQIGTICCDSTQTIIQIQCSNANQVLSSYLQTGYFGKGGGVANMLPTGVSGEAGAISSDCQLFLQNCLIGSASYYLTDLVCRVEYQSYPEDSYAIVRDLLYQPISYQSIRSQADIITSTSGQFTQRLSIGGSALLNAIVVFIIPNFPVPLVNSGTVCRPQDCFLDYTGLNIPSCGDARSIPTLDSVYIPWTQFSVQCDNKVYESNPIIPINNSSYASYLKAQEGAFAVWQKYLPQDLRAFTTSRFCYILPINPKNDREQMIVDQQVIISISFDDSARKAQAQTMGTVNQTGNGNFWLQSFAVVSQSLVNCDYVKI